MENPPVDTNLIKANVDIQKTSQMFEENLEDTDEDEAKYYLVLPEKYHGFVQPLHK